MISFVMILVWKQIVKFVFVLTLKKYFMLLQV
jgi:hypothetical protein